MPAHNNEMTVVEITEPGGPEVLQTATRPIPAPAKGEVVIKVAAAGVNGPDLMQRRGLYPPPDGASPLPGLEVSGHIAEVGAGVDGLREGDAVTALTNGGGYAEYVAVPRGHCLPIPEGVELTDAAGLPEVFFTVWNNVFFRRDIAAMKDALMLVHGGAGGIGSAAIAIGAALGLRVFATAGGEENCRWCMAQGAERAIDYKTEDFVEITRAAGGANIILDIIGGDYIPRNIKAAAPDCRIINLAYRKGSKVEVDFMPVMLKRLTLTGSTLRARSDAFKAAVAADIQKTLWPLFARGKLATTTHATFPLADAAAAHRLMESGSKRGKILLVV